MASAAITVLDDDDIRLQRSGVRFPIELRPVGVDLSEPASWPSVDGRLEYFEGRLLYMPPCADIQQYVAVDVVFVLRSWAHGHSDFLVGANEAGMKLGGDVRAADAAIWRRTDVGPATGRIQRVAPVLAVEVAGTDEDESVLRAKASWYLAHGVAVVWLVLPEAREVIVLEKDRDARCAEHELLPQARELPGLEPRVASFFSQL
jgi:Uma2 family endonuclease